MVKVTAPMMSLGASGTLGNAITFASWKGRPYVRERVIPSNPKSDAQTGRRALFRFLTQNWDAISPAAKKDAWQTIADQLIASTFNAYLSENMKNWHNFLAPAETYPITRTGTPSDNVLTGAVWEENRIKLTLAGATLGDAWLMTIYAKEGSAVTPSVGSCILGELDATIASHDIFWTPPTVATWHFDSIACSDDGVKATAGGAQNAVP